MQPGAALIGIGLQKGKGAVMRVFLALVFLCGFITVASAQRLQPGDTLSISVYQDPKLDRQVLIGPSGFISFPLAGQIRAAGMTPATLESVLKSRLKDKYSSDLDITVALVGEKPEKPPEEDLKPRIFVTGEVLRPGYFVMRMKTNVLQAIALAGGFGPFAAKHRIQVRRQVRGIEEILPFDYQAFFYAREVDDNWNLRPGDVVIVPERGLLEFE